jgi:hypothetical protein
MIVPVIKLHQRKNSTVATSIEDAGVERYCDLIDMTFSVLYSILRLFSHSVLISLVPRQKLEDRHVLSIVNKQLLEAAFHGTLSEKVQKLSDLQTEAINPLKSSENEDIEVEGEAKKTGWDDSQLSHLQKAVKTVATTGKKKLPVPGFHAIQGLRKARESGWSVKDEGPANAEKYGIKFWEEVARSIAPTDKHGNIDKRGIQRSADECIDAYVRQLDPSISGTVLEKLLSAQADPNVVDRVRCFVHDQNCAKKN